MHIAFRYVNLIISSLAMLQWLLVLALDRASQENTLLHAVAVVGSTKCAIKCDYFGVFSLDTVRDLQVKLADAEKREEEATWGQGKLGNRVVYLVHTGHGIACRDCTETMECARLYCR